MTTIPSFRIWNGVSIPNHNLSLILPTSRPSCGALSTLSRSVDLTLNWATNDSSSTTSTWASIFLNSSNSFSSQSFHYTSTVLFLRLKTSTIILLSLNGNRLYNHNPLSISSSVFVTYLIPSESSDISNSYDPWIS